jgi:hypothetical protein
MVKKLQKAQIGNKIRVKLEDHKLCKPCVVESLGNNTSGRLVYITTCSCGKKLKLMSTQIEIISSEKLVN